MKVVNPIGKKPVAKADFKAYGCVCGAGTTSYEAVWGYGHAGCSHCGCSCGGGSENAAANSNKAYSKNTF